MRQRFWWGLVALTLLGAALASPARLQDPKPASEAKRLNNLGVATMNQQRFEQALALFVQAHQLDPDLSAARLNQGIALFNLQRFEPAREILLEVTRQFPRSARAWYNLGLLNKNVGQAEAALEAFERVLQLDINDADSHYFRGLMLAQLQRYEPAIAAYQRALALNPFHVSAEFGLARAAQRLGDTARAREHLERFQQLTQEKLGAPMSLVYGEQGVYSLTEEVRFRPEAAAAAIPVRFLAITTAAGLPAPEKGQVPPEGEETAGTSEPIQAADLGSGACFLDYDGDGHSDLFLVNNTSARSALYRNRGDGRFEETTSAVGLELRGAGRGCTAGDYDNDGWTDLAVSLGEHVVLLHNQGGRSFRDHTQEAGIQAEGAPVGLTFVDFDHDADLDLYVTRVVELPAAEGDAPLESPLGLTPARNLLWRNNGNGTFTDWTQATGLAGLAPSLVAAAADLNNDRAIDLVLTGGQRAPTVFSNPREGRFPALAPWASPMPAPTVGVVVFDFNKDGWMDVAFTHWGRPGLTLWRNLEGMRFEPVALPELAWKRGWGLAALDFDNDGWLDLATVGETDHDAAISLLRNRGPEGFAEATAAAGLTGMLLVGPRALLTADYDADGDTDLLVTQNGGRVVLLRNQGGNKNNWLRVSLKGLADNKSAIGTKVEVFAGTGWQKWEVQAASGYLGQSALEIIAGLGQEKEADIVRMLWPTGVLQDEIQLPARVAHTITEIDRRGSSCPILFAWNGSHFEFVSDVIGAAIVGHWVGPGQRNLPDPDEYVKVEGARLEPRDGRLELRFLEPMEELVYLDQVRLLAVDHPAGVEVNPNEYFASRLPTPDFKVITSRKARLPRGAWDDRGRDVLAALRERDRRYVAAFALSPFKGLAELHGLELDLGAWDSGQPLRLLLHGYIEYFTATSLYAAHQAGLEPIAPYVEALTPEGRWLPVLESIGFPAGLRRTMVADLTGRLPAGTRRIRLLTNLQIYWDQILLDTTAEEVPVRVSDAALAGAALRFRGYPRSIEADLPGDLTYTYEEASLTGPYARPRGSYTRYGEVLELLREADDLFAIFGPGEEVALSFDAARLPTLPAGWSRDYFFYANGFVKDMDFYEAHALTVTPLPFHGMGVYPYAATKSYPTDEPHLSYRLDYNTRHVSAKEPGSYRFDYRRKDSD